MKDISILPVRCISIRDTVPEQVVVGQQYSIDRLSIWIDADGDAYGVVYDRIGNRVGEMQLKHFSCL